MIFFSNMKKAKKKNKEIDSTKEEAKNANFEEPKNTAVTFEEMEENDRRMENLLKMVEEKSTKEEKEKFLRKLVYELCISEDGMIQYDFIYENKIFIYMPKIKHYLSYALGGKIERFTKLYTKKVYLTNNIDLSFVIYTKDRFGKGAKIAGSLDDQIVDKIRVETSFWPGIYCELDFDREVYQNLVSEYRK